MATDDKDLLSATPPARSGSAPTRCAAGSAPASCAPRATPPTGGACRAREIERLAGRPARHRAGDTLSARNRFPGVVRSVEIDGVMALVEIEAGPHLVTAAVTRDAVEELGLAAGRARDGAVKATSVMVERGEREARSRSLALAVCRSRGVRRRRRRRRGGRASRASSCRRPPR